MLHDGNKIFGDAYSEESIKLINDLLITQHEDRDTNSLFCRFNKLMMRVEDQEISHRATWNSYLKEIGPRD
jgi:DUF438 domain-containing protein